MTFIIYKKISYTESSMIGGSDKFIISYFWIFNKLPPWGMVKVFDSLVIMNGSSLSVAGWWLLT